MTPALLQQLFQVAEARKDRDLAALQALVAQDRACEAEIEALARTQARDWEDGAAALTPFAQQALRLAWAEARIAEARRRRAALAPEIEAARQTAAQSLGKHQALERIIADSAREAAQRRSARAERETPPPTPE